MKGPVRRLSDIIGGWVFLFDILEDARLNIRKDIYGKPSGTMVYYDDDSQRNEKEGWAYGRKKNLADWNR